MSRITPIMVVVVILSTIATVPLTGAATQGTDVQTTADRFTAFQSDNATANASANVTPGGQLTGIIGVQQSELDGEIDERTFGLKIAQAASNESKATVVAEQVENLQDRLEDLNERKQELREARRNGSISETKYRAEMADLATQTETVKRLANATETESAGLPESVLAEKGINVDAVQTLKVDASNLTGQDVAAIAQSIAGPSVGTSIADDYRPDDVGPDERDGSETSGGNATTTADGDRTTTTADGDRTTTTADSDRTTTASDSDRDGSDSGR